jgi:hypothetical protein
MKRRYAWAAAFVVLAALLVLVVRLARPWGGGAEGRALAAVSRAGGAVEPDGQEPGGLVVDLHATEGADAVVAELRGLHRLRKLDLAATDVTDEGLAPLAGLTDLEELNLSGTRVGDAGLAHLAGLTRLRELGLGATRVTDAGLAHLRGLTRLGWMNLAGTKVTAAGVKRLQQDLPRLDVQH